MNSKNIPVYVMPVMKDYIENNSLLNQLIVNKNIDLCLIENELELKLDSNIDVIPFEVPHRNELSETVGFKIKGKNKSAFLFSLASTKEEASFSTTSS